MNTLPTTEERIWAVLSHLSTLAFGMGIFLPILGWSEQRQKSKYASFHCLQALGYQSLGYTIWLLTYLVVIIVLSILLFVYAFSEAASGTPMTGPTGMWTGIFVFSMVGLLGLYVLFPMIAAVACALGRDYRYPILGHRLAKYLDYEPTGSEESASLIEEHEERWVAAMGHFSVIIALWGLIAPLAAWILQGKHSAFLKFQSIQIILYQVFVNLLYLGAGVIYTLGILIVFTVIGLGGNTGVGSSAEMAGIVLFFVTLILAALIMLALPLFHILGQWAGYRVLKGDDYRYPLIGRLVEKWGNNTTRSP